MTNENPAANIVRQLAERICQRVARRTIRLLQGMNSPNMLLSGPDSGLKNVWEEVCVQIQAEESFWWEAYEETISQFVEGMVKGLERYELEAAWLSTPEGEDWDSEPEEDREPFGPVIDDIVQYVVQNCVLAKAGFWSNQRIREYVDR